MFTSEILTKSEPLLALLAAHGSKDVGLSCVLSRCLLLQGCRSKTKGYERRLSRGLPAATASVLGGWIEEKKGDVKDMIAEIVLLYSRTVTGTHKASSAER